MATPPSQRRRPRASQSRNHFQPTDDIEVAEDTQVHDVISTYKKDQTQRKENLTRRPSNTASPARRRAFIDTQDDAVQITDFDTQDHQGFQHESQTAGRRTAGKRKQPANDDVSGDEGFADDTRDVDASQRRREAPRIQASPNKRVRIQDPPGGSTSGTARRRDEDSEVQTYDEQKQIMASQRELQPPQRMPRPNTGRVRWDSREELALEDMIKEYGCSWAHIKRLDENSDDPMFEGRDQVALKDKARNMKVAYIL
jgi:hypothetical protein